MRQLRITLATVLVLVLGTTYAAQAAPQFNPAHRQSPGATSIPEGPPDPVAEPSGPGVDPTDLLSGVAFLTAKNLRHGLVSSAPPASETGEAEAAGPEPFTLSDGSQYTFPVTSDTNQDVEPSVRTLSIGATVHTTVASIKFTNGHFRNFFATTTNFSSWTRGMLPIPAGYTDSGDPMMDENSYTTGIAPLRQYIVGIIFQSTPNAAPNAIGVWHSDDGGATWSQPTLVAVNTTSFVMLDKPAINVSQWSGDNGVVFVAYVVVDEHSNPAPTQILVSRSTDGGITFSTPVLVISGNIEAPQIVSSPFGDKIYVVWPDFTTNANALKMSTSTESLASWSAAETAATGNFTGGNGPASAYLNNGTGVRALTIPMARYNWVDNSLGVVWHEFESPTSKKTDIFFVAKNSAGWHAKQRINTTTANDQFMPGVDFDGNGQFMVTFYDRSQDPNNLLYKESWVRTDFLGNVVNSGALNVPFSNTCAYSSVCAAPFAFIGDYQDSWWWTFSDQYGNRFNAVWTEQTSNTTGDIYVTGIQ